QRRVIMAYPPPPGLKTSQPKPAAPVSSTLHPSLPARPPPSAGPPPSFKSTFSSPAPSANAPGTRGYGNYDGRSTPGGFGTFSSSKPRALSSYTPSISAAPTPPSSYGYAAPSYATPHSAAANHAGGYPGVAYQQPQQPYYPPAAESYAQPTPPQIRNPFPLPGQGPIAGTARGGATDAYGDSGYDPDYEAQIAQWQSAYSGGDDTSSGRGVLGKSGRGEGAASAGGANAIPLGGRATTSAPISHSDMNSAVNGNTGVAAVVASADGRHKTVVRSGGGKTWQDDSLLEWDPAHFRIHVGNLAGEVTDESLLKAFSKYASVQKARVVREKRTTKSKGYGFVSFSDGDDYFKAYNEMKGKYIGSHPVTIEGCKTQIQVVHMQDPRKKGKGIKGQKGNGGRADTGAGVHKKQPKMKGGLKLLG
ncbi:hypothetical protein LTR16_000713, partial [Cryomyces antarcticus]